MSNGRDNVVTGTVTCGTHIVGLFDVLNQRQQLQGWTEARREGDITEFKKRVNTTIATIAKVRSLFRHYVNEFSESRFSDDDLAVLNPEQRSTILAMTDVRLSSQHFSDTTILYTPVHNVKGCFPLKDVFGMLAGGAMGMLESLAMGIAIRGAVCTGLATNYFESEIYGPALASAYHLESEVAEYPRVLVGEELIQLLAAVDGDTRPGLPQVVRFMASTCRSFTAKDDDGQWIVDYLGPGMHKHIGHIASLRGVVDQAAQFIMSEYERFSSERSAKLAARYARMNKCLQSRISLWRQDKSQ